MMNSNVLKTVTENGLINGGDTVFAAVSGGADSTALLHILFDLSGKIGFTLKCVHINHCLRGDESDRDEKFVCELCGRLGIECTVRRIDVNRLAKAEKHSVELAARHARYEVFSALDGKVATAHTKNDRAETLIMNLARGCGLSGLSPIPVKRGNIIRPLINCERAEIEKYLTENGFEWVVDSTNLTDDYTRNKVRHNIIPLFEQLNPSFSDAVERLGQTAQAAVEHLQALAATIGDDASIAKRFDDAVLSEYVRMKCGEFFKTPDSAHTALAVKVLREGGKTQLCDGLFIEVSHGKIGFYERYPEPFSCDFKFGTVKTPYYSYDFRKIDCKDIKSCAKINNLLFNSCFDYDKIIEHIIIRTKKDSDAVRLYGRGCTKKLRRLYNEADVPVFERGRLAVICDGDRIVWAQGFGVAEQYAVDGNTQNAVLITVNSKGDDFHK